MKTQIEEKIKALFPETLAAKLIEHLQPCIRFELSPGSPNIGQSKIGGQPDIPIDKMFHSAENPNIQLFVQLNLSELSAVHPDHFLPKDGMIYIFGAFFERASDGVFPALPGHKSAVLGFFAENNINVGRRSTNPSMLEIPEQKMTLHPYYCTLSNWDSKLEGIEFNPDQAIQLEEAIAEICGFEFPSSNLLVAPSQHMPDNTAISWAAFDMSVTQEAFQHPETQQLVMAAKDNFVSLLQMELEAKHYNAFTEEVWSGHLNMAIHKDRLAQAEFTEFTYAYYPR